MPMYGTGRTCPYSRITSSPSGEAAANCACSYSRAEWARGATTTGWVDYLGTRETYQGRGLGRAALLAGLHWLRAEGATSAMLITMAAAERAQRVYLDAGFRVAEPDITALATIAQRAAELSRQHLPAIVPICRLPALIPTRYRDTDASMRAYEST